MHTVIRDFRVAGGTIGATPTQYIGRSVVVSGAETTAGRENIQGAIVNRGADIEQPEHGVKEVVVTQGLVP